MKFILTFRTSNKCENTSMFRQYWISYDFRPWFPTQWRCPHCQQTAVQKTRTGVYGLWAEKGLHPTTPDVTQGLLLALFEWQPSFNLLLRQARGFNDKSLLLFFFHLPGKSEDYDIGLSFYLFGHENWKYFYDQIINVNRLAVSLLLAKIVQRCAQIKYYPN